MTGKLIVIITVHDYEVHRFEIGLRTPGKSITFDYDEEKRGFEQILNDGCTITLSVPLFFAGKKGR